MSECFVTVVKVGGGVWSLYVTLTVREKSKERCDKHRNTVIEFSVGATKVFYY